MQRVGQSRRKISNRDGYTSPEKRFAPYKLPLTSPSSVQTPKNPEENERTQENILPPITAQSKPAMKATKTVAERTREQSILDDPLANLLSPYYVECRQCNKQIKLSSKSAYDTFHWRNHRKRCVKTFKKKGKSAKSPLMSLSSPMNTSSNMTPPQSPAIPMSDSNRDRMTPSLISDEDDQQSERSSEVQSPVFASHAIPAIHSTPSIPYYDYNVEVHLSRSHPGYISRHSTRHLTCTSASTGSQSWSWSHLKPSRFAVEAALYDRMAADDDDNSSDRSLYILGDERVQEAARTLSLLSRAR